MNPLEPFLHSTLSDSGAALVCHWFQQMVADTAGHIGAAILITTLIMWRDWSRLWFWGGLGVIVAKELAFDLPNANWSNAVWIDSIWDIFSWFAGFAFQFWALMHPMKRVVAK